MQAVSLGANRMKGAKTTAPAYARTATRIRSYSLRLGRLSRVRSSCAGGSTPRRDCSAWSINHRGIAARGVLNGESNQLLDSVRREQHSETHSRMSVSFRLAAMGGGIEQHYSPSKPSEALQMLARLL